MFYWIFFHYFCFPCFLSIHPGWERVIPEKIKSEVIIIPFIFGL